MENCTDLEALRTSYKKKYTKYLESIFRDGEAYVGLSLEKRTFILICDDSDDEDADSSPVLKKSRHEQDNNENETNTVNLNPDVKQVKKISGKVVLTTLYQPWAELGTCYVSTCCAKGPDECEIFHKKYSCNLKEAELDEEYVTKLFKKMSPTKAGQFLRNALAGGSYPVAHVVQYILLKSLCQCEESMKTDIFYLNKLLEVCAPCDKSKVNYYKKILFGPVRYLKAPDGVFWWCIYKIEDFMKVLVEEKNKLTSNDSGSLLSTRCFVENLPKSAPSSHENMINKILTKLAHLFRILDFLIKVMEADLTMGLLKNITNLSHYVCGNRKPFIAMAFWENSNNVGTMNAKIRHIMKLYFKICLLYQETDYPIHFRRLISLIAGSTYASQRNLDPPVYPNIRDNCKEFASDFAYIMLQARLSLSKVLEILKVLRPIWLQFLICSYLLEVLDGRNEYKTLKSLYLLLKDLNDINEDFPSSEEMSTILLRHSSDTYREHGKIPRKLFCKLAVLTPLAITLHIRLTGISRLERNLDHDIQFATGIISMQFNHPSLRKDCCELKKIKELVCSEQNNGQLAEALLFLFK